jgi:hypothetical protein
MRMYLLTFLGQSETESTWYASRYLVCCTIREPGAVDGMRIAKGNQSTQRKPAPVPLYPPQVPHDLTWDQTEATMVGSWRLTA